ncbi:CBS domain-containing protein [Acuticoccus mangrovi]|uniref:CBS domain-containing protein n=1 Tax=Acuticoccus mangrovi TaxID=2796142 RepID=A0A934IPK3_9HYPH|nr:CBS domain-containing protein [Acuticoccus mangrovi]MBJ3776316.1 CBS domain-containing protein [Acuticoccus mangrovi]
MSVKNILKQKGSDVFAMSPDSTLLEVANELTERRIGAVVIMDGDRLAGILSERDIVRQVAHRGPVALELPAASTMTQKVETCGVDDLIDDLMTRMTNSRFRHMPVVDEGRLVGVISIGDVVKLRIEEAVRERDDMRAYILST